MKEYKAIAHINSLNGEMAEITVLKELGNNDYTQTIHHIYLVFEQGMSIAVKRNRSIFMS